jgi:nitroreductase
MNQQKWHFTIIQNRETLEKLAKTAVENMLKSPIPFFVERAKDPNFNVFNRAPTVVVITADEKAGFTDLDCGMAAQNITLAAESLEINSCVMGLPSAIFEGDNADAIKKELGIPAGYRFVISIALGYRDMETPPAPPRNRDIINYIR